MACGVTTYTNKVDWYALGIGLLLLTNTPFQSYFIQVQNELFYQDLIMHNGLFTIMSKTLIEINPALKRVDLTTLFDAIKKITKPELSLTEVTTGLCATMASARWGDSEVQKYLESASSQDLATFDKEGEKE